MNPRIEKFLRQHVMRTDLAAIDVSHVKPNGKIGAELWACDDFSGVTPDWIAATANAIETACDLDAGDQGATQVYVIRIFAGEGDKRKQIGRMTYRVAGGGDIGEDVSSEPATPQGVVAQSMRHAEAFAKIMAAMTESMALHSARTIDALSRQNVAMQERHNELLESVEEVLTHKHERALELKEAEGRGDAIRQIGAGVKTLLPAIAEKLTGKDMTSAKVLAFAQSITPEQFDGLSKVLSPNQQALVVDMFQAVAQKEKGEANGNES